jgi:hypothetical protein
MSRPTCPAPALTASRVEHVVLTIQAERTSHYGDSEQDASGLRAVAAEDHRMQVRRPLPQLGNHRGERVVDQQHPVSQSASE